MQDGVGRKRVRRRETSQQGKRIAFGVPTAQVCLCGTAERTLGGKDKFDLMLEWVITTKGNETAFYFFSLSVKLPFISDAMLSCESVRDLHVARVVVFCLEVSWYLGRCPLAPRVSLQEYKPLMGFSSS